MMSVIGWLTVACAAVALGVVAYWLGYSLAREANFAPATAHGAAARFLGYTPMEGGAFAPFPADQPDYPSVGRVWWWIATGQRELLSLHRRLSLVEQLVLGITAGQPMPTAAEMTAAGFTVYTLPRDPRRLPWLADSQKPEWLGPDPVTPVSSVSYCPILGLAWASPRLRNAQNGPIWPMAVGELHPVMRLLHDRMTPCYVQVAG